MRIKEIITLLYGDELAVEVGARIEALVDKYDGVLAERGHPPLDQRTALLITYGDQVSKDGEPPLKTLAEFLDAHAREMISGVHILPFYPSSSDDGFSVMDYNAVDGALGTWDDIARLGKHFDLMFDAVINHASVQGIWFQKFLQDEAPYADYFFTVTDEFDTSRVIRPRALPLLTEFETTAGKLAVWTTFSADQADLNYKNPDLLVQILEILLFYVARGARFLRLDAIAFLWKESGSTCLHLPQTHAVIQLVRAVLNEIAPDVILVTETNVPHTDNISYFGDGTNEAQWVYNFCLPPLTLHTLQTGDATKLAQWAKTLQTPSEETAFFNFLASHDGIGLNPARGILSDGEIDALVTRTLERGGLISYKTNPDGTRSPYEMNINYLDALSAPNEPEDISVARFLCAQAILLALAGVPGIYFHSLLGSRGDRAGADQSGIARRINRQKFSRAELERELADANSRRSQIFSRYAELLRVRRQHGAFHPDGAQLVLASDARMFVIERTAPNAAEKILCVFNVSGDPIVGRLRVASYTCWRDLLTTVEYHAGESGILEISLGAYQTVWAWNECAMTAKP